MIIRKYILCILFVIATIQCQSLSVLALTDGNHAEMFDIPLKVDKKIM